jgi:hypothetical protein
MTHHLLVFLFHRSLSSLSPAPFLRAVDAALPQGFKVSQMDLLGCSVSTTAIEPVSFQPVLRQQHTLVAKADPGAFPALLLLLPARWRGAFWDGRCCSFLLIT